MCGVLGLVVRERDPQLRDRGARVYVSNHVTPFDHNMVNLPDPLQHRESPGDPPPPLRPPRGAGREGWTDPPRPPPRPLTSASHLGPPPQPLLSGPAGFVCWSRGLWSWTVRGPGGGAAAVLRLAGGPPHPLLLFPEEEATNGREGLLRLQVRGGRGGGGARPESRPPRPRPPRAGPRRSPSPFPSRPRWPRPAPGRFPFRRWCQSADPPGPPAPGVRERGGRLLGLGAALGALHPFHRLPSEVAAARPPGARGGQRGAGGPRAAAGGRGAGPRRDSPHAGGQSRTPQTAAPRGPSGPRRCGPPARAPSRPLPRRPAPRLSPPPSPAAPPSPPAPLPAGPGPDGRLATLSQRVKEVLPHVPLGVIRRDLARTGCVDATITNLLERPASADRRHPPPPPPPAPEAGSPVGPAPRAGRGPATPPSAGPDRLSSGRPSTLTFAKSPRARHESLRERKEALYEQARRRFLEKHARRPEDGP
uniref:Lipid droplet-regulating VLDL assembly factor AUP1 n=1 Tax=Ornithorhynchus anatinus TaxID=9258 RepID=A0A6I8PQ29_ORNAN